MKLVFAIVNRDDSGTVVRNLGKQGFYCTKLPTTGGFLLSGNITLLIGVEDALVQQVIDIIKTHSHRREQMVPSSDLCLDLGASAPFSVTIGGATIFVVDVDRFEKV